MRYAAESETGQEDIALDFDFALCFSIDFA